MFSRSIGFLVAPLLVLLPLMIPLSLFYSVNAILVGIAAAILAGLTMMEERAATGVAALGVWTAFTPFVFRSTFVEMIASVCWGITMVVAFVGPFSHAPVASRRLAEAKKDPETKAPATKKAVHARSVSAPLMKFS